MKKRFVGRYRDAKNKFKPDREYIEKAVEEYLKDGGTITKLEFDDELSVSSSFSAVDDFLLGD